MPNSNIGRVALVIPCLYRNLCLNNYSILKGASRGMGAHTALCLARDGFTVALSSRAVGQASDAQNSSVAATKLSSPTLTLADVKRVIDAECNNDQSKVFACDVTDDASIQKLIDSVVADLGRIDVVVYNAGAIFWGEVKDTTNKKFQLLNRVNTLGLYKVVDTVLPIFNKAKSGRFVVISPPIYSRFFRGKTSYAMTKVAMTVLTHGLAMELKDNVAITSLWPATALQSAVTEVKSVPTGFLRDAKIFGDAIVGICNEPAAKVNGLALLDEDYLREFRGVTDFSQYRLDPNVEPPRMMPMKFPSLLVEEQDDRGFSVGLSAEKSKL
ncbi:hypothetical protein HDU77_003978 [Chytriomyces hyalinus]|nr:hypothetical protein HDU77_003978 [Chytriomyces hyalinus]